MLGCDSEGAKTPRGSVDEPVVVVGCQRRAQSGSVSLVPFIVPNYTTVMLWIQYGGCRRSRCIQGSGQSNESERSRREKVLR